MTKAAFVYPNSESMTNQGPGYVISAALDAGHEVDFFDLFYVELEAAVEQVTTGGYDVVMLSASALFYGEATHFASLVKARTDVPILIGGLHATVAKDEILKDCPDIDYVCVGEGEEFVVDFLDCLQKFQGELLYDDKISEVENLVYRNGGKIVSNPVRPPTDLSKLPRFRYELWPPESIVQPYPLPGFCYVYATRGCPYDCAYCANHSYLKLYGKKFLRQRPIEEIIQELQHLRHAYGAGFFYFGDEMMLYDMDYCTELFERVHNEVKLPFGCMARVEKVTPEMAELLRRTGCGYVAMGVECANEEFRRKWLGRHHTNAQIKEAFRLINAIPQITTTAFMMRGWPVTNDDELTKETREFVASLKPNIVQDNNFFPFPGTRLYDYCAKHDLIDLQKASDIRSLGAAESVLKPIPEGLPCSVPSA